MATLDMCFSPGAGASGEGRGLFLLLRGRPRFLAKGTCVGNFEPWPGAGKANGASLLGMEEGPWMPWGMAGWCCSGPWFMGEAAGTLLAAPPADPTGRFTPIARSC